VIALTFFLQAGDNTMGRITKHKKIFKYTAIANFQTTKFRTL